MRKNKPWITRESLPADRALPPNQQPENLCDDLFDKGIKNPLPGFMTFK
jgi:hypothetical protein